jgi:O-antigen/teichoic acid export membrane protein
VILSNFRTGFKFSSFSFLISGLSGVLLNLIVIIKFDLATLGIFNQALVVYVIFSQFANLGLSHTTLYFSSNISYSIVERKDIIYCALVISFFSGIIFSIIGFKSDSIFNYFFKSYDLSQAIKYSSLGLVFFPCNKVLLFGLNGLGNVKVHSIFQALRSVFIVLGLIILIALDVKPFLLISTFALTESALFFIILSFYIYKFKFPKLRNSIKHLKKVIKFGIKSFINPLLTEFYPKIDIVLLGFYFNDKIVGIYSLASIFIEGLNQIPLIFTINLNPRFSRLFKKNKKVLLIKLIKKVFKNIILIMGTIIFLIIMFGYFTINHFFDSPASYNQSLIIFLILSLGIIISSRYYPLQMIFNQNGLPQTYTLFYIFIIIINLLLSIILINIFEFYGVAFGTALANICSIYILKILCKKKLSLELND